MGDDDTFQPKSLLIHEVDFISNLQRWLGVINFDISYGNFCPECKTSSDNIRGYDHGLFRCVLCDYIFLEVDIVRRIGEFWEKKEMKN